MSKVSISPHGMRCTPTLDAIEIIQQLGAMLRKNCHSKRPMARYRIAAARVEIDKLVATLDPRVHGMLPRFARPKT